MIFANSLLASLAGGLNTYSYQIYFVFRFCMSGGQHSKFRTESTESNFGFNGYGSGFGSGSKNIQVHRTHLLLVWNSVIRENQRG